MIGLEQYTAASKQSHRGWLWNRLTERLQTSSGDAVGVVLIGPHGHDVEKAIRHGCKLQNIIAVDVVKDNVDRHRSQGGIGIVGDIRSVLRHWNDRPLDFAVLDTCGTFYFCLQCYQEGVRSGAINANTAVYMNMQRGRESQPPSHKSSPAQYRDMFGKHRGKWVVEIIASHITSDAMTGGIIAADLQSVAWCQRRVTEFLNPAYDTYRSRRVVMDAVVFTAGPVASVYRESIRPPRRPGIDVITEKRMPALKAVRTKALRGIAT